VEAPHAMSSASERWSREEWGCAFAVAFCLLWSVPFLVSGMRHAIRERHFQTHRAEAVGEILKRRVELVSANRRGASYRPELVARFSVDGTSYESRLIDRAGTSGTHAWAEDVLNGYASATTVPVYYNSADPTDACLDPVTPLEIYTGLLVAPFAWAIGSFFAAAFVGLDRACPTAAAASLLVTSFVAVHFLILTNANPSEWEWFTLTLHGALGVLFALVPRLYELFERRRQDRLMREVAR
jgi:hypothetical protein